MSRLSIKTVERTNLPFGRYKFMVLLGRSARRPINAISNAGEIEDMRNMLRTTCKGKYKLIHHDNYKGRRVYTRLYLTEAMDLAMIKLVHSEKLHKIYKIKVANDESL